MKVKVVLDFSVEADGELVSEIKDLCRSLTPDGRTISIQNNGNIVEATFKRFPGRQIDIVDSIAEPFRIFLENLQDIVIYFESRNKKF